MFMPICGNTKCHSDILWKHKMSLWHFVFPQNGNDQPLAILCLHKKAMCHFVFPQKSHVPFCVSTICPKSRSIRRGERCPIFFWLFNFKGDFLVKTWFYNNCKPWKLSNSEHFFDLVKSVFFGHMISKLGVPPILRVFCDNISHA